QRHAHALLAAREQDRSAARRETGAQRRHLRPDVLHRIVDGERRGQRAARAVDVDLDVLLGRLVLEKEQLRRDGARHVVVDDAADEDDTVLEQSRVNVVGALATSVVGDHRRDEMHLYLLGKKPIRSFGFGGGLAIARYALKSATLRSASSGSDAVASRNLTGGSSGQACCSASAPSSRARSAKTWAGWSPRACVTATSLSTDISL